MEIFVQKLTILLITLLLSLPILSKELTCDNECKKIQTENYLRNIVQIFIKGSTVKEIDNFLDGLHEEIKYEHQEYEADFDKTKWRKAFINQLELGSYVSSPNAKAKILNIIYGKNHAAVEYSYGTLNEDGSWTKGHVKFALFGFKGGKVSLVREYW